MTIRRSRPMWHDPKFPRPILPTDEERRHFIGQAVLGPPEKRPLLKLDPPLQPGEPHRWFRLMVHDRPAAPWRPEYRQALQDARDSGNARGCKRYGRVMLTVPAWIACVDLASGEAWEM
jgi:hypothetical protein